MNADEDRIFNEMVEGLEPEIEPVVPRSPYSMDTLARLGSRGLIWSAVRDAEDGRPVSVLEIVEDSTAARFLRAQAADTMTSAGEKTRRMYGFMTDVQILDDDAFNARWPEYL